MKKFRVGIIGCGNMGGLYDERGIGRGAVYTHAGMYSHFKEFEISAAADLDRKRLSGFVRHWRAKRAYRSYADMLRAEKLDVVSIATPDETHTQILKDVLRINRPRIVFTEKPLALNAEEGLRIRDLARKLGVRIVVDYVRRWDVRHRLIKKMIEKGSLGDIISVSGYYVRGLRHNGCQLINLIQYICGKIVSVTAIDPLPSGSSGSNESLSLRCLVKPDIPCYILPLDRKGYKFSAFELDIFGSKGRLRLDATGSAAELYFVSNDKRFPNFKYLKSGKLAGSATYGTALLCAGREMISFLKGGKSITRNTVEESIRDLAVIDGAFRSASLRNRPVPVAD